MLIAVAAVALVVSSEPLAKEKLGDASVRSRRVSSVGQLDEPLAATGVEPVVFVIDAPHIEHCMPDFGALTATANGAPMKREHAGGSHHDVHSGPSHFPTVGVVCDPIQFVIARGDIKPAADGAVTFAVSDKKTTLHFTWAHLLEPRDLRGPAVLKPGDKLALTYSPASDELAPSLEGGFRVCLEPTDADRAACRPPDTEMVIPCTHATVDDAGHIEGVVPKAWTCTASGTLALPVAIHPRAIACDARSCVTEIQGLTQPPVTIAR